MFIQLDFYPMRTHNVKHFGLMHDWLTYKQFLSNENKIFVIFLRFLNENIPHLQELISWANVLITG